MLCPCSFIVLNIHTESQMQALGLYFGGFTFERIFGLVYWGPIFEGAQIWGSKAC